MRHFLFLLILTCISKGISAQYINTIKGDSVKITKDCDSSELIIENHTQGVPGFLYNTGRGRTKFKRGAQKINDSLYLVGSDTINLRSAWLQGGNSFGSTGVLGTLDNNHLDFYTNNSQRTRMTNSGKLLIGTTTDNGNDILQVNGSVFGNYFTNSSTLLGSPGFYSGAIRLRWGTGDGAYISYYFQGRNYRRAYFATPGDTRPFVLFDSVGISFLTTPYVAVGAENNVWNSKLSVFNPQGSTLDVLGVGHMRADTTFANDLLVKKSGNVLIGTSTDNTTDRVQIAGNTGAIFIDSRLSLATDRIRFGGNLNVGDGQESLISASVNSGANFTNVLSWRNGYIGIGVGGTTAPGWVVGKPVIGIRQDGNIETRGNNYLGVYPGPTNASSLVMSVSDYGEWTIGAGYPNGLNSYFFGTLLATPTVGNKRAPLQIGGDQLQFMTGPTTNIEAGRFSEAGNLMVGSITDNGSKLQVTGTGYFSGNVGLGTSSPSAQFHTTGTVRFAGLTSDTTQTRIIVSDANGNLYYRAMSSLHASNGILPSSMADNGRINSSLAVNGTLTAQKLKLSQTGWPDYVFAPGYQLPSLASIEQYIKHNNHLPGIPSAAEVVKTGIDVGDHQAALLKKIEELTLYTIEQDKKSAALNQQLEYQRRELESLKKDMAELKEILQKR